jgi:hypothetical protein
LILAQTFSACSVSLRSRDSAPGAEQAAAAFYGAAQTELRSFVELSGVKRFQTGPQFFIWNGTRPYRRRIFNGEMAVGTLYQNTVLYEAIIRTRDGFYYDFRVSGGSHYAHLTLRFDFRFAIFSGPERNGRISKKLAKFRTKLQNQILNF